MFPDLACKLGHLKNKLLGNLDVSCWICGGMRGVLGFLKSPPR